MLQLFHIFIKICLRMIFASELLAIMALIAPLSSCSEKNNNGLDKTQLYSVSSVKATDRDSLNDNITSSRRNAITRAVAKASPAVVGINVTEIREQRVYDPFEGFDDP